MIDLSIVIVNWNGVELTRNALKSIIEKTNSISYEIIVIDNGSVKNLSVAVIKNEFPGVHFIIKDENLNYWCWAYWLLCG